MMTNPIGLPTLIIVDDEAAQMKALCDTLGREGYSTSGFTSATSALAAFRSESCDLLLTDLKMPGMDGIALLRAAREIDPNVVTIMMTGHGTIDSAVQAMKVGALDYILKPFDLSAILPVLARALHVRRLRSEKAELEQRVRQRTEELEATNKELDAFAHSVSHDLRAPLRAISGFGEFLQSECSAQLDETGRGYLSRILEGTHRMGNLIDDLLQLSHAARAHMERRPVNLSLLAAEVAEDLRLSTRPRNVRFVCTPDLVIPGDRRLLRIVMTNLLGNAWKYTSKVPDPQVEFGTQSQGEELIFYVRDNGAGFDMKYVDRLFTAFQRLHPMSEFEGTGVGLATVQRIIHRHGGKVWAEGQTQKGATFYFTLPK